MTRTKVEEKTEVRAPAPLSCSLEFAAPGIPAMEDAKERLEKFGVDSKG